MGVRQKAHRALFLTGLQRAAGGLIREGLRDLRVEPRREPLVPGFAAVKAAALDHGALGASLSGAGPSVFAWFASKAGAEAAAPAMRAAFAAAGFASRSEEHTSELQSLMRNSYAVFCLKKNNTATHIQHELSRTHNQTSLTR